MQPAGRELSHEHTKAHASTHACTHSHAQAHEHPPTHTDCTCSPNSTEKYAVCFGIFDDSLRTPRCFLLLARKNGVLGLLEQSFLEVFCSRRTSCSLAASTALKNFQKFDSEFSISALLIISIDLSISPNRFICRGSHGLAKGALVDSVLF